MLRVYLSIDGSNSVQIKEMEKIATVWYEKVRAGHITRYDAWYALQSTVLKKLEYPLTATTLKEEECDKIMSPILQGGLPRIGICRSMARDLVYTPIKYQGLGVNNLYISQGLSHVKAMMNHVWQKTTTEKLLISTM